MNLINEIRNILFRPHIVKIMGGLGNQMFQYAFGKALEAKTGRRVIYDNSWFEEAQKWIVNQETKETKYGVVVRDYNLDIFKNIDINFATEKQLHKCKNKVVETKEFIYDEDLITIKKPSHFEGYFQNEGYLKDIKDRLKKEFQFPEIEKDNEFNQNWLKKIKECESPIFIHVRRGDYLNLGWGLSTEYYKKAIEYIKDQVKNPTFFVFGQDCEEYIKNEFGVNEGINGVNKENPSEFYIIGENNSKNKQDWKDIALMLECKHAIIANSTFSWWGAWLGKANNGIVIAPTPFINGKDDIICEKWVKIEK